MMISLPSLSARSCLIFALGLLLAVSLPGQAEEPAAVAKPGISFIEIGDKPKTVTLTVVATYNAANFGMNFNGHFKGNASYVIPTGWTVEVAFTNASPVPHSVVIVEQDMTRKLQVGEPYWDGAASPNPTAGTDKSGRFSFVADESGDYAIVCGFPAHALSGHWVGLVVSDEAKKPRFEVEKNDAATPEK